MAEIPFTRGAHRYRSLALSRRSTYPNAKDPSTSIPANTTGASSRAILLNRLKLFIYRQVSLKLREKSGCLSIELAGGRSALLPENERVIWVACLFRMVLVGHAVIFFNQALDSRLELLLFGDALVQIFNQVHQTGRRKVFVLLAIGVDAPEFVHLLFGKRMCEVGPPLTKVAKSKASQRTVLISWGMPCALVIE